jgi:superfamily I DNA/RNA helicase
VNSVKDYSVIRHLYDLTTDCPLSLSDWVDFYINEVSKAGCPTKGVRILTFHASKGLEFNRVIIAGLLDSAFPNREENYDEASCLYFVALTRATSKVTIMQPTKQRPSKLLTEMLNNRKKESAK